MYMSLNVALGLLYFYCCNWINVVAQYDCLSRAETYQEKYVLPILSSLSKKGYNVIKGNVLWLTDMKDHGGSPSSAYMMFHFSDLPANLRPNINTAPSAVLFRSSDAMLFTGCSSPPATYIGLENYAYAKYRNKKESIVFASMNGAINEYFLNVSNEDRMSNVESPYNSIFSVITTGDKVTFKDIFTQYQNYNISDTVNNIWIPDQYFKYIPYNFTLYNYNVRNYSGPIDSFMPVHRVVNHFDDARFNAYVNYTQPCYLITAEKIINDSSVTTPRVPFTQLFDRKQIKRGQVSEFDLYQDYLNTFIDDVQNYFITKYNMSLIENNLLFNYNQGLHNYGWVCYNNSWNCQGDLRDEQYWGTHNGTNVVRKHWPWKSEGTYYLQDNSMFLLIGINHFSTNFSLFDNIIFYYNINQYLGLFEPIFMFINDQYNNSANQFVNNTGNITTIPPEILSKFYIIQVARPITCQKFATEFANIPSMCPNHQLVSSTHKFALYTRNLLNPSTLTRPSTQQIIPDTFIRFKIG